MVAWAGVGPSARPARASAAPRGTIVAPQATIVAPRAIGSISGKGLAAQPAVRTAFAQPPAPALLFPLDPTVRCYVFDNFRNGRFANHDGEDIGAPEGTPVLATVAGTLTKKYVADTPTNQLSGNGWRLVSSADSKSYYFYAHLQALEPTLDVGSRVERGDVIGWVGHTGDAGVGNDHLHFEVHPLGGDAVDPLPLLKVPSPCTVRT